MEIMRQYVKDKDIEELSKQLIRQSTFFIAGHESIFVPSMGMKFIDIDVCKEWPNDEGEVILMTPQEAARAELNRHCKRYLPKRGMVRKWSFPLLDMYAPQYFNGGRTKGELVYIDLKSAYWQLYKWMWLDTYWPRGMGNIPLNGVASSLERWKTARNSVVGVIRSKTIQTVKGVTVRYQPFHNPYLNPDLWMQIMSILHEIAAAAVLFGACYVNTDGYIFRSWSKWQRFVDMLVRYDLEFRLHQSDGEVIGWNSYKIEGLKTTEPYKAGQRSSEKMENIRFLGHRNLVWFHRHVKGGDSGRYSI